MSGPILVTGAAGFVGGHLLDVLVHGRAPVIGWHRPDTAASPLHPQITWTALELLDREAVTRAIADLRPDAIYHLAGAAHVAASWQNTLETYQGNILATHHLCY